jgi:hypothetical protein
MKIQISKERSVELSELTETDALIWASAVYLVTPYSSHIAEMTDEDFDTFIEENCLEEHEYKSAQYICQRIDDLASYLLHSIKK